MSHGGESADGGFLILRIHVQDYDINSIQSLGEYCPSFEVLQLAGRSFLSVSSYKLKAL